MLYIKKMELFKAAFRKKVDLRAYEQVIRSCVQNVIPLSAVLVYSNYYEIRTPKEITNNEARLIGRGMGKTQLSRFLVEHLYDGGFTGRSGKLFIEKK